MKLLYQRKIFRQIFILYVLVSESKTLT
jgi:hypothetical protein